MSQKVLSRVNDNIFSYDTAANAFKMSAFMPGAIKDEDASPGSNGQVLTSTGGGWSWAAPVNNITTLQNRTVDYSDTSQIGSISFGTGTDSKTLIYTPATPIVTTTSHLAPKNSPAFTGTPTVGGQDITSTLIGQWNISYGWGNHAVGGYLTSSVAESTYALQTLASNGSSGLTDYNFNTARKDKLANIAENAQVNVQSNWNEVDSTSDGYIQNKPSLAGYLTSSVAESTYALQTLASNGSSGLTDYNFNTARKDKLANIAENAQVNVQSNWNEVDSTSDGYIQNKPSLAGYLTSSVAESTYALQTLASNGSSGLTDYNFNTARKDKLANIAENAQVNVQSNWNEVDSTSDGYIQNKPSLAGYLTSSVAASTYAPQTLPNGANHISDYVTYKHNQIYYPFFGLEVLVGGYNRNGKIKVQNTANQETITIWGYNGFVYAYGFPNYSDDRVKSRTKDITHATDTIMKTRPVIYEKHANLRVPIGKEDTDLEGVEHNTEMGFNAQDIQKIPELAFIVSESEDTNLLAVNYTNLISLLCKSVQELNERIKILETSRL